MSKHNNLKNPSKRDILHSLIGDMYSICAHTSCNFPSFLHREGAVRMTEIFAEYLEWLADDKKRLKDLKWKSLKLPWNPSLQPNRQAQHKKLKRISNSVSKEVQ